MTRLACDAREAFAEGGETPRIEIVSAEGSRGLGVRLLDACSQGAVLGPIRGAVSGQISQHSIQIGPDQHLLDLDFVGYLLHSCAPNCMLDLKDMRVVALEDIDAHQFLTIDYAATEDRLYRQFACACGAPTCRGWVTGRRETPDDDGARWLASLR